MILKITYIGLDVRVVEMPKVLHFFREINLSYFLKNFIMFLGYATTFVNKSVEEPVLMDLKHLLIEAKQQVPPFLATLETEEENFLNLQAGKFF